MGKSEGKGKFREVMGKFKVSRDGKAKDIKGKGKIMEWMGN